MTFSFNDVGEEGSKRRALDVAAPIQFARMSIRRFAVVSLLALLAACGAATKAPPPAPPPTVVGSWREFWGIPGETDVEYHDEYKVGYEGDKPFVVPLGQDHPDVINSVTITGDDIDIVIHTSFDVHYKLHLDPGGATMSGTATTPDKTVPIRWERLPETDGAKSPPAQ
jgi:hypothetical protein